MNLHPSGGRRSVSPASSERSTSPVPRPTRRAVEDSMCVLHPRCRCDRLLRITGLYKADKGLRRYAGLIEKTLGTWEIAPEEWSDYIAFLGRLLKVGGLLSLATCRRSSHSLQAIQSGPKDVPFLPHTDDIARKIAQCLNPALPSGVHQKALELYYHIFSTFGVSDSCRACRLICSCFLA